MCHVLISFFHFTTDKLGYIREKKAQVNKRRRNDDIYKDLDDDEEVAARSNKKIGKFKYFISSFIINLLKPIINSIDFRKTWGI